MELAWRLPALKEELTVSDITEGMVKQELSLSALHNILTQLLVILQRAWEATEARLLDDVSEHGSLQGRAASFVDFKKPVQCQVALQWVSENLWESRWW